MSLPVCCTAPQAHEQSAGLQPELLVGEDCYWRRQSLWLDVQLRFLLQKPFLQDSRPTLSHGVIDVWHESSLSFICRTLHSVFLTGAMPLLDSVERGLPAIVTCRDLVEG